MKLLQPAGHVLEVSGYRQRPPSDVFLAPERSPQALADGGEPAGQPAPRLRHRCGVHQGAHRGGRGRPRGTSPTARAKREPPLGRAEHREPDQRNAPGACLYIHLQGPSARVGTHRPLSLAGGEGVDERRPRRGPQVAECEPRPQPGLPGTHVGDPLGPPDVRVLALGIRDDDRGLGGKPAEGADVLGLQRAEPPRPGRRRCISHPA